MLNPSQVFEQSQQRWNADAGHSRWHGLTLLGVDGVAWQSPDTPENQYGPTPFPQVRMVCQIGLTSYMLTGSVFEGIASNEMQLATGLILTTPEFSLTLFDRGFYSLGLLYNWIVSLRFAASSLIWLLRSCGEYYLHTISCVTRW